MSQSFSLLPVLSMLLALWVFAAPAAARPLDSAAWLPSPALPPVEGAWAAGAQPAPGPATEILPVAALAATPDAVGTDVAGPPQGSGATPPAPSPATPPTQASSRVDRSAAAAIISGSPRPGVIEHQLVRSEREGRPEINISYPSFGVKAVDSDIRRWVTGIADAFDASFDDDRGLFGERRSAPELWGSYSVTAPSANGLSITFEIWTYTGSAQGNLDIITLNFNSLTSQRLGLVDIFEDPDAALSIMSSWAYKALSRRLGGMRQEQMLRAGLAPVPENFASLTLIPSGIRINFQPYQVAPWAAGAQRVDIPLDELRPARPLLLLWGE